MKSIFTKGLVASAAAFAIAGAFAQVQTGEPSNGSKLGVTPPPSTSTTTDTSRLSTDCSTVAARQRAHQDGGAQVNGMTNCGNTAAVTTMGAAPTAQPATVGSTGATSSNMASSSSTAAPMDNSSSTNVASASPAPKKRAKADRG
jgi:hypothetical protein